MLDRLRGVADLWPKRVWAAIAAAILVLVGSHVFAAMGATIPLYWEDEAGYLGNAQVMAGVGEIPQLRGRPYYLGWSILLVPLWWVFQDGAAVYQGAVVLAALFGIALAVPLALLARRLGLSAPWAIVVGCVIAAAPGHTLLSGFGLPESLLAFLVAFAAYFALRFHAAQTLPNALGLAVFVATAFATHGRAVPLVIATALWLVWSLRRAPVASASALVTLVTISGASFLLYRHITSLIYGIEGARESVGVGRILNADPFATLMSGTGQIWYLVIAWVGLTVPGFMVLGRQLGAEWKRRAPGIATWTAVALVGAAAIAFTNIASAIARGSSRIDALSYGRYLEPFVIPIALVGLVMVARGLTRSAALGMVVATALVSGLWFAIVWPNIQTEGTQWWAPINVTGVMHFGYHAHHLLAVAPWLPASVVIVIATVFVLILRKHPVILVAALTLYFVASTGFSEAKIMRPYYAPWQASFTLREVIAADPLLDGQPVSFDMRYLAESGDIASKNAYQILLAPTPVLIFDSGEDASTTELVISRCDWDLADQLDARAIAVDHGVFDSVLWVLPGDLQDRLDTDGKLIEPSCTQ